MGSGDRLKCLHCSDIIQSMDVHDFKYCSCRSVAIDGGSDYCRLVFRDDARYSFNLDDPAVGPYILTGVKVVIKHNKKKCTKKLNLENEIKLLKEQNNERIIEDEWRPLRNVSVSYIKEHFRDWHPIVEWYEKLNNSNKLPVWLHGVDENEIFIYVITKYAFQ